MPRFVKCKILKLNGLFRKYMFIVKIFHWKLVRWENNLHLCIVRSIKERFEHGDHLSDAGYLQGDTDL